MLVSTESLAHHLDDSSWVVFDCRHDLGDPDKGRLLYEAAHIRGAHFAHMEGDLSGLKTGNHGRHPLPDPDTFADFLAGRGVTEEKHVVAYDDAGGAFAARLWWLARWIGLDNVAVLDGGWGKWEAAGLPTSRDLPDTSSVGKVKARPNEAMLVRVGEVVANVSTQDRLVVDARSPERFRGEMEPIDPVAGHIPNAVNRAFNNNLREDLTMRSPEALETAWKALLGDRAPSAIVHQCGSGITACVNVLAMEHAGMRGSKLYVGSWSEWCADPDRPVATGPA